MAVNTRILTIALTGIFFLVACASTEGSKEKLQAQTKTDRLSARTLAPGQCGLFVWSADAQKRFILFSQSKEKKAVWHNGENAEPVKIAALHGTQINGQFPEQSFVTDDAEIVLKLKDTQIITDGTRYRGGTLSVSSQDDWARIIPVVGLSACQPKRS